MGAIQDALDDTLINAYKYFGGNNGMYDVCLNGVGTKKQIEDELKKRGLWDKVRGWKSCGTMGCNEEGAYHLQGRGMVCKKCFTDAMTRSD